LALAPSLYLAFQLVQISQRGIQAAVLELHTKMAEKLSQQIDTYFKGAEGNLAFALSSLQKKMEWTDKQELLRSLTETQSDIVEICIIDSRGRDIIKVYNPDLSRDAGLHSHGDSAAFLEAYQGKRRIRNVIRYKDEPALEMFYPMGQFASARVLVSLRSLGAQIASERVGGTGFAVLVDARGEALFYPREHLSPEAAQRLSKLSIVQAALQSQSIGSKDVPDFEGKAWVSAYAPVASVGGAVIMLQQRYEAYLSAVQMRRAATWILALVIAFAVLASIFLARQLILPLLSLTRGAEAVSRGDFQARVEVSTGDELQELAETFNKMASELYRYSLIQVDRLVAEQRKTEAIMFSINDGILMFDGEGRIQLANRRVRELLGMSQDQVLEGKTLDEVLPESPLRRTMAAANADPRPDKFNDVDLSSDKNRRFLRVISHPVVAPRSVAASGVVTAVRDVTYEKELDQMKEEFLHCITHDLRNPLGSAIGFVDVLLKGAVGMLNPEQFSMVSSIKRSTSRLMGMINNILDIAKMESGRIQLRLRNVSLAGVAGRSMAILESLAQQKNIAVILDVTEEFAVNADSDLLERVVTNLIGNAIKFTPKEGVITVTIEDLGQEMQVCVRDTGEGIPPEYIGRLFQKFEQVAGQKRGGTGLGLAIARFFVNAHLGRIWVESELGKGSRFLFTIPKGLALKMDGAAVIAAEVK
jgi:NtrC-family two-component system sensor histidine kinase KinB